MKANLADVQNAAWMRLSEEAKLKFRLPNFPGLWESVVPFFVAYLMATFDGNWTILSNVAVQWLIQILLNFQLGQTVKPLKIAPIIVGVV
jgi:hypothetical protein